MSRQAVGDGREGDRRVDPGSGVADADRTEAETGVRPEVHVTAWVSVNGSRRALIVDPTVDLAAQPFQLGRPAWVMPAPPDL